MKYSLLFIVIFIFNTAAFSQRFKLPPKIDEASGLSIVNDTLYWINDSGNEPFLFATDSKGKLLKEYRMPFPNVDWEDMSMDNQGRFLIGDIGNNENKRTEFQIYRWDKTNEETATFRYKYGNQTEFPPAKGFKIYDAEAMIYLNDTVHIFSKSKMGNIDLNIYRYELPLNTDFQEVWPVDTLNIGEWLVTAAALHPDGRAVALLSYRYLVPRFWFPSSEVLLTILYDYPENDFFKGRVMTRRIPSWFFASQYECIDWIDRENLLIGSERTLFIKQKAKVVKLKKKEKETLGL